MSYFLGRRAVVIGAGIGGLAAAGALAQYVERVEILERDWLATSARSRSGTPQDRHPHGLLAGGLRALERIFPDFERDLAAAGAVPVTFARDVQFERPDVGVLPKRDFGISVLCATRPLIELVLRRRAEAVANITLRPASRVIGIVPAGGGAGVRGIQFVNGSGRLETLDADLVVDASGRGAPTLTLLDALCWDRPQMTEIGVDITYATAVVEIPPDATTEWKAVLTLPDPPHLALHAIIVPTEDGRWITAIADHSATAWIETWDAFLEASRSLITPTLYNALRYAEPPDGIRHYRFPVSIWKHFERLPQLPRGVLPVADALCRFNPIHGEPGSDRGRAGRVHGRGRLGARDALDHVDERRPRFPPDARQTARQFRGSARVRGCPFPCRCSRSGRSSRDDRSRPPAAASSAATGTGHYAADRGRFRQGSRLTKAAATGSFQMHPGV
jgi:2-polyprenyl-6-methoxyphenol hydroxylase-like FAD-dependent oxidoreductase